MCSKSLARIVSRTSIFSRISPTLKSLHWLPIKYRCIFKTSTVVYKYIQSCLPKYFSAHLVLYSCLANTRRSNPTKLYLSKPTFSSGIGTSKSHFSNSFAFDGPNIWNDLPLHVRTAPSVACFRNRFKTYLFSKLFLPSLLMCHYPPS